MDIGTAWYLFIRGVVDGEDLFNALDLCGISSDRLGIGARHKAVDGATELLRGGYGAQRAMIQLAVPLLEDGEGRQ